MSVIVVLAALAFLMFAAYRGYSVILFAPLAALGGAALLSTVGGFLSGNLWLGAGILLAGALLAGGLFLRLRARRATSCERPARAETAASRLPGAEPRGPQ